MKEAERSCRGRWLCADTGAPPSVLVLLRAGLMRVTGGPSRAAVLRRVSQTGMDLLVLLPAYL